MKNLVPIKIEVYPQSVMGLEYVTLRVGVKSPGLPELVWTQNIEPDFMVSMFDAIWSDLGKLLKKEIARAQEDGE